MIIRKPQYFICSCLTGSPESRALNTFLFSSVVYKCRLYSPLTTRSPSACPAVGSFDTDAADEECATYFLAAEWQHSWNVAFSWEGLRSLGRPDLVPLGESLLFVGKILFLWCETLESPFEGISFGKKHGEGFLVKVLIAADCSYCCIHTAGRECTHKCSF